MQQENRRTHLRRGIAMVGAQLQRLERERMIMRAAIRTGPQQSDAKRARGVARSGGLREPARGRSEVLWHTESHGGLMAQPGLSRGVTRLGRAPIPEGSSLSVLRYREALGVTQSREVDLTQSRHRGHGPLRRGRIEPAHRLDEILRLTLASLIRLRQSQLRRRVSRGGEFAHLAGSRTTVARNQVGKQRLDAHSAIHRAGNSPAPEY